MGQTLGTTFVWQAPTEVDDADDADNADTAEPGGAPLLLPVELSEDVAIPKRGSAGAAGYDLSAAVAVTLPPNSEFVCVQTGVKVVMDAPSIRACMVQSTALCAEVRARSGLTRKGIVAFHGTIDSDYRGEVGVLLKNTTDEPFDIDVGDRIAQLVFQIAILPTLAPYENVASAFPTDRGEGGFGSTGVRVAPHPYVQEIEGA